MEETIRENKMGTAPLFRLIITMSVPTIFSMLIQALYNVVDSIFVSRIGEHALTAVSLAFPIQMVIIAVAVGTGIGVNSLVSRRLGEKNNKEADDAATHGIILSFISSLLFIIIGLFLSGPFIGMFANDSIILNEGTIYFKIVCVFSFGVFIQISVEKITQATGKMIYSMIFQLVGAVINIVVDPILIFGYFGFPKMGVAGAAVATVLSQIIAMLLSLYILFFKKHEVSVSFKGFHINYTTIKNIYAVGFPAIIVQCIGSFMITFMNGILSRFSQTAVAVFGIYFKLQSFVFMPVFGLNQGTMPIMGYNYGARNKKRLKKTLDIAIIIAVSIMVLGMIIFMSIPDKLLLMFDASEEMLRIGVPALRIISMCFIPASLGIVFSNFFQAIGYGKKSLAVTLLRQLILFVPIAYILANFGLTYIWFTFPASEFTALIYSIWVLNNTYKTKIKSLDRE